MYQIFVVEDELLIRQNIRHIVENMTGPYAFCGEASDGEMALSMMQDLMPDILVTDIRMPFLDGFELIRHIRSIMPWIRIIIISGYGDFEYAQKAISLGAQKYLLKPLRAPELTHAIEELAQQLEESKSPSRLPSGYDQDELHSALHQHFMHQLLGGSADTAVLLERARYLKLDVVHPQYQVVVFGFDSGSDQAALRTRLTQLMDELRLSLYYFNEFDQLTLLTCGADEAQVNEETYRIINIVRHELKPISPVITTVAGSVVTRISAVSDAYKKAKDLLKHVSGLAPGQVVDIADTAQLTADMLGFSGPFTTEFQQKLLSASDEQEVHELLAAYFASATGEQFNSMLMRYSALADILKMSLQMNVRLHPEKDARQLLSQLSSRYDLFGASASRERFETLAEQLICDSLTLRQSMAVMPRTPPIIARADAYVAEHFCDPNISLISVARHVGMSSAHFSTVFSQAHGTPFISYLTALRIEKAKELLVDTDMKLSAIAMEIGYNEPNYFSHVFRKAEGVTPKEYRVKHGKG